METGSAVRQLINVRRRLEGSCAGGDGESQQGETDAATVGGQRRCRRWLGDKSCGRARKRKGRRERGAKRWRASEGREKREGGGRERVKKREREGEMMKGEEKQKSSGCRCSGAGREREPESQRRE